MEIYLVRHTSVDISPGYCYGQSDLKLSDNFEKESTVILSKLVGLHFDIIYSSPLIRCQLLAKKIGLEYKIDNRLIEMNFGNWEMKKWDDITDPNLDMWYSDWINTIPTDGESFFELYSRSASFLNDIRKEGHDKVLIISHGGVIASIKTLSENGDIGSSVKNIPALGSITLIKFPAIKKIAKSCPKVVILRHGESIWNNEKRLTGWTDISISQKGKDEAIAAAKLIESRGFFFQRAYCSYLQRTEQTIKIIFKESNICSAKYERKWELNENHYGKLQGELRIDVLNRYGRKRFNEFFYSYHTPPPLVDFCDIRFPGNDSNYKGIQNLVLPVGESYMDLSKRVLSFWKKVILEDVSSNKNVLIVAHGNSIREILRHLNILDVNNIQYYQLQTAKPIILNFQNSEFTLDEPFIVESCL